MLHEVAAARGERLMKDMQERLEKLRDDAAECAVIGGLAADKAKGESLSRDWRNI